MRRIIITASLETGRLRIVKISNANVFRGVVYNYSQDFNWVQLNLRYIVDYKKRRSTRDSLHNRILKEIQNSKGKIELGSTTFEIVGFPKITFNKTEGNEN